MTRSSLTAWMLVTLHASICLAQGLPRVVAVIVRHGHVAYVTSAGSLDSARNRPIAEDAVFRMYSMTKPIATTAVMQLVERGKVKLTDPVSKYVAAFANTKVYAGGSADHPVLIDPERPVTIADLLTHTSGTTYAVFGIDVLGRVVEVASVARGCSPRSRTTCDSRRCS